MGRIRVATIDQTDMVDRAAKSTGERARWCSQVLVEEVGHPLLSTQHTALVHVSESEECIMRSEKGRLTTLLRCAKRQGELTVKGHRPWLQKAEQHTCSLCCPCVKTTPSLSGGRFKVPMMTIPASRV
jgi:hypothetical protein